MTDEGWREKIATMGLGHDIVANAVAAARVGRPATA